MQRVSGSGATGDGKFKETPAPATRVSASWLNSIQEEIAGVIEHPDAGDEALNGGDNAQLRKAIFKMIESALPVEITEGEQVSIAIGPLIIKVGATLGSYHEDLIYTAFTEPFPGRCFGTFSILRNDTGSTARNNWTHQVGQPSVNGFYTRLQFYAGSGATSDNDGFSWIAIGR